MTPHSPPPTEATAAPRRDERPPLPDGWKLPFSAYGITSESESDDPFGVVRDAAGGLWCECHCLEDADFTAAALNAYASAASPSPAPDHHTALAVLINTGDTLAGLLRYHLGGKSAYANVWDKHRKAYQVASDYPERPEEQA
jgi:hypothetical protein